jgi:hypothetical protein
MARGDLKCRLDEAALDIVRLICASQLTFVWLRCARSTKRPALFPVGKRTTMKHSDSSTRRRIAYGVFILPARRTDFDAVTLPFTKRCSQSRTHRAGRTCLSRERIGTRKIARTRLRFLAALCEYRRLWLEKFATVIDRRHRRTSIYETLH